MPVSFFAATTKENRQGTDAEVGPNIDFFLKPLMKLKRITVFELDQSKNRPLMLRLGYRYMPTTDGPTGESRYIRSHGPLPTCQGRIVIRPKSSGSRDRLSAVNSPGGIVTGSRQNEPLPSAPTTFRPTFGQKLTTTATFTNGAERRKPLALSFRFANAPRSKRTTNIKTIRVALRIGRSMRWAGPQPVFLIILAVHRYHFVASCHSCSPRVSMALRSSCKIQRSLTSSSTVPVYFLM